MDFKKLLKIAAGALLAKVVAKGVSKATAKPHSPAKPGARPVAKPATDARELVKKARKAARLGKLMETNFRKAMIQSAGDPWIFIERPIWRARRERPWQTNCG